MLSQVSELEGTALRTIRPCVEERRRLGQAIWVLLLLLDWTDPADIVVRSGASIRAEEIAQALGLGERQARRELQRLRRAGWIELQNTGRGFKVRVVERGAA